MLQLCKALSRAGGVQREGLAGCPCPAMGRQNRAAPSLLFRHQTAVPHETLCPVEIILRADTTKCSEAGRAELAREAVSVSCRGKLTGSECQTPGGRRLRRVSWAKTRAQRGTTAQRLKCTGN